MADFKLHKSDQWIPGRVRISTQSLVIIYSLLMLCRFLKFCGLSHLGRTIRAAQLLPKAQRQKGSTERRYTNPSDAL
jgi:hypothetical protein